MGSKYWGIPKSLLTDDAHLYMRPGMIKLDCSKCQREYWTSGKAALENYIQTCHKCKKNV